MTDISLPYTVVCSTDDREEWIAQRRTGIGASEIAAVLGESPWCSALELWSRKTGQLPEPDLGDVEPVRWGVLLERVVGEEYARRAGRTYVPSGQLLRSIEHPWALASLDGWTAVDDCAHPLEIKTAGGGKTAQWESGPPPEYALQIQQQLLVTGAARATIACLLGGQRLVWCDVQRDEITIRRIQHAGAAFWRAVQERTPPAPDGSQSARSTLAALYPHDSGDTIVLPASLLSVSEDLDAAKADAKAADARVRALENQVKAALGTSSAGALPDGSGWSWKEQYMPERTLAASSHRVLRRVKARE